MALASEVAGAHQFFRCLAVNAVGRCNHAKESTAHVMAVQQLDLHVDARGHILRQRANGLLTIDMLRLLREAGVRRILENLVVWQERAAATLSIVRSSSSGLSLAVAGPRREQLLQPVSPQCHATVEALMQGGLPESCWYELTTGSLKTNTGQCVAVTPELLREMLDGGLVQGLVSEFGDTAFTLAISKFAWKSE
eukprot:15463666-Alexandrium_andersonii.AAC.1